MSDMTIVECGGGHLIHGDCTDPKVTEIVERLLGGSLIPLTIADPPYGGEIVKNEWDHISTTDTEFVNKWMMQWTRWIERHTADQAAMYVWQGIGRPGFRSLYKYVGAVEEGTSFQLANHITWAKKRGYGIQHNLLWTREELLYFCKGDIKKPRLFNVPYLDEKRGYPGFNKAHPAKSEFFRRTNVWKDIEDPNEQVRSNVWTDITEIFRGKVHTAQKPTKLHEILINIHTKPGEVVFDPFGGSGTTAKAAMNLGRKFILIEKDDVEFGKMVANITAHATFGTPFKSDTCNRCGDDAQPAHELTCKGPEPSL